MMANMIQFVVTKDEELRSICMVLYLVERESIRNLLFLFVNKQQSFGCFGDSLAGFSQVQASQSRFGPF